MYLAQINIGRMLGPMESDLMKEFRENLDAINALAEASPGFVWRLKDEDNNATAIKVFDDEMIIINMSVWESMEALFNYVYKSGHKEFVARRKEWFEKMTDLHMAMWFIDPSHQITTEEAVERLEYLRKNGASPFAFDFRNRFSVEDFEAYQNGK